MVLKFNRNVIEVIGYSTDVSSEWVGRLDEYERKGRGEFECM